MSVCIELPAELEASLRGRIDDLDQAAKEAFLVDLYRQQCITRHEVGVALGLDRFAVDGLLNRFAVTEDLPTADEIRSQADALAPRCGRVDVAR